MNREAAIIVLGTAHRLREPGKGSPDKRLKECIYSREICTMVSEELKSRGYRTVIDYEPLDLPKEMQSSNNIYERNKELTMRVNIVNRLCDRHGAKNVIYVSIHCNAAGADGKWHDAKGWQVCVSTKASERSKALANSLYDAAKAQGLRMRQPSPQQHYWPQSLYVLNSTKCPAILTENLFQDNKEDVDFLMSDRGKQAITNLHVEGIINFINNN